MFKLKFSKLGSCVVLNREEFIEQNLNLLISAEEPHDNHVEIAPELRLCAAMLLKALSDAMGVTSFQTEKKPLGRKEVKLAADARGWILEDSIQPFSFYWVCEHLDIPESRMEYLKAISCGN